MSSNIIQVELLTAPYPKRLMLLRILGHRAAYGPPQTQTMNVPKMWGDSFVGHEEPSESCFQIDRVKEDGKLPLSCLHANILLGSPKREQSSALRRFADSTL